MKPTASRHPGRAPAAPAQAPRQRHEPNGLAPGRALLLPTGFILGLALFALFAHRSPYFFATFLGAAWIMAFWALGVYVTARAARRRLRIEVAIYKHHWVQALAQVALLLYWGWYVRLVYAFLPLVLGQLIFAYAVDSLLTWSRRDTYRLGFGPMPVILSINLFLWFRPQWFYLQLAMIAAGFLAKELIRWNREGRRVHIFNPSSFTLAAVSLALILTRSSNLTFGNFIANSQFDPPHIYLAIVLASLPGQLLFGVARTTLPAVLTAVAIGAAYFHTTGTYLFYDAFIPVPVFLGMHLIVTDPSTSPRSDSGRVVFGALYAVGVTLLYVLFSALAIPTFYDKLIPVPVLNLLVPALDRLAARRPLSSIDPARLLPRLTARGRGVAFAGVWVAAFFTLVGARALGDHHPGQYLPFWVHACHTGSERACRYADHLTVTYCENGSGWACNEAGVAAADHGQAARTLFDRGCELGDPSACHNVALAAAAPRRLARAAPRLADLPVVLRGTKPPLAERRPDRLLAVACREGWPGACAGRLTDRL